MDRLSWIDVDGTPIHVNKQDARAFGKKLRDARDRRYISVDDAIYETRLSRNYIEAMEDGRYEDMPGIFYSKSFLRIYATFLSLDVTEALKIFHPVEKKKSETTAEAIVKNPLPSAQVPEQQETATQAASRRPPRLAEYLLHFVIPREQRTFTLGDLEQEYGEVLDKFGQRPARMFYYAQVARSLWPYLQRAVRQIRSLLWLIELVRSIARFFGWH